MKRVIGFGGIFVKCKDPQQLKDWYRDHLGFNTDDHGATFHGGKGYTVWSTFKEDTDYFAPSGKEFMINLRVENLDWLLGELKKEGVEQLGEMQVYDYGKFAHIMDPEGTKIELWESNDETFGEMVSDQVTG